MPDPAPIHRALLPAAVALALVLGACGGEAETAETEAAARPVSLRDPLAHIPREELYGAAAAENLWSPRFELEVLDLPPGWDGARIAILSDFHLGLWEENAVVAAAAVERALRVQPDLVVLLGDYVAEADQVGSLRQIVAPLQGRRAIAVLGDRDVRSDAIAAQVVSALRSAGVTVLRNEAAVVELNGDSAWIGGLDPGLVRMSGGDQNFILASVAPVGRTPLLLTHLPGLAARAPSERYPVVVAANTFCGEVEVPGTPRLSWVRDELFPGGVVEGTDDRLFRVRGQTVVISCGLGYGFVPVRFGAPPEVPIVTLRRIGPPTEDAPRPGTMVEDSVIQRFQETQPDTL
ncbi:MAG TPA: hypothetical protein VMN39_04145 [Longimicrobiaceae bacterium]|nr:hypothetical protein [Longimicrobiaceae bacterium]